MCKNIRNVDVLFRGCSAPFWLGFPCSVRQYPGNAAQCRVPLGSVLGMEADEEMVFSRGNRCGLLFLGCPFPVKRRKRNLLCTLQEVFNYNLTGSKQKFYATIKTCHIKPCLYVTFVWKNCTQISHKG